MSEDTRTVVVTKAAEGDKDYLGAVVHPDKESAEAALAENKRNTPWFHHAAVPVADFDKESESATAETAEPSDPANTEGN